MHGCLGTESHSARSARQGSTRIREALAQEIGAQRFAMWFGGSTEIETDGARLLVRADGKFRTNWIERHFRESLERIAASAICAGASVVFETQNESCGVTLPLPDPSDRPQPPPLRRAFMPRWKSLDHFVVGPGSKLAFAAACQLAEHPEEASPILFFHGGCGVGKTHLLQGICQRYRRLHPTAKVRYSSAEMFLNEYVSAVRTGSLDSLRARVRRVDLLVIDDIHFLSGKPGTQTELLLTLDACLQSGVRVVSASDAPPRAIKAFAESLSSRFSSGLVVSLEYPDSATRLLLIQRFALARGLALSTAAIAAAGQVPITSVREIEGLVSRMAAERLVDRATGECGPQLVLRAAGLLNAKQLPLRAGALIKATCAIVGVTNELLLSRSRQRRVSLARSLAALALRESTPLSWPEIARELGQSTHSSAHAAAAKAQTLAKSGAEFLGPTGEPTRVQDALERIVREARSVRT
ncbi:MAG: AAA family ATPase [Phycisphaerales bacterium]|nr:AAA family ATPase [Phycisphaerales bacterium]